MFFCDINSYQLNTEIKVGARMLHTFILVYIYFRENISKNSAKNSS